jgi:hypothetical protein
MATMRKAITSATAAMALTGPSWEWAGRSRSRLLPGPSVPVAAVGGTGNVGFPLSGTRAGGTQVG